MAPEQALDARAVDARADIYSLGCCLYYLMTGQRVYKGATAMETMLEHRDAPIPSLRAVRPDCPPALDALFRRMIAKKPQDRPASMDEVIAELECVRRAVTRPIPFYRKHRVVLAGILAAVLLLGVFISPLLLPTKADPDPSPDPKAAPAPVDVSDVKKPAIELVRIEPGKFFMGSSEDEKDALPDEMPRHEVRITRGFLLGKFEVTQEEYQQVMGVNPSAFSARGRKTDQVKDNDTKRHPVESISWGDAVAFCNRLSERHGFEPYYRVEKNVVTVRGGKGYRLPTEAEWEYACRAGSDTRWSFGSDVRDLDHHAWHAGNSNDLTHAVGTKKPNAWGLFDMHGNVPEWCWDRYDERYYQKSPASDPPGAGSGAARVYRGGGWNNSGSQMRSATRIHLGEVYSVLTVVGLRVARDL
jgi:formylglycine-generating enzyme required for sulfatase activity